MCGVDRAVAHAGHPVYTDQGARHDRSREEVAYRSSRSILGIFAAMFREEQARAPTRTKVPVTMMRVQNGLSTPSVFLKRLRPWEVLCSNVSGVAAAVSSISRSNCPPGSVSRVLGGYALVDPAFVVVEVLVSRIGTGLLLQACRAELVHMLVRLPKVSEQLK
jgi:hypothetical protein